MRIPKLGAVPTVLTLVVAFSSHNVQALPQFSVFPGFGFGQAFQPFVQPIQNFNNNVFQPFMQGVMHMIMGHDHGHKFVDDGTESPQATGHDEMFPRDCGRDPDEGTGKLCFPDGLLCQNRVSKAGVQRFRNHYYYFSWLDSDFQLSRGHWSWFNARNYCRKRCMDLVSLDTQQEYDWIKGFMDANVPYFWTSGRLCDFDGCDRPDLFPKNINGWFWSATQVAMPPTNSTRSFHSWSHTGGLGVPQPDNREETQLHGETEACLAVLNNYYGDGIKWHDVACTHEKPIICEDVDGHLAYARQHFPAIRIP